ncbi:hypothetical protein O0L34_g5587 [Tuta absoluta]|nr:hypothetical protein O0L34_g5587 [Tuta absoluta]
MPGFLGNINTPQRVNTQQYSHLNPFNETHLPGICSSLLKLDPPVQVSLRSEDRGNSSALQQCLPPRPALQPVNQEDMQSLKAFPVLDVTLQAKNYEDPQSQTDTLAQSVDAVGFYNTTALVNFHPISTNSPFDLGLATTEVLRETSPEKLTALVDNSRTTFNPELFSSKNPDPSNKEGDTNVDIRPIYRCKCLCWSLRRDFFRT